MPFDLEDVYFARICEMRLNDSTSIDFSLWYFNLPTEQTSCQEQGLHILKGIPMGASRIQDKRVKKF